MAPRGISLFMWPEGNIIAVQEPLFYGVSPLPSCDYEDNTTFRSQTAAMAFLDVC
jgi:hypothetical protein